MVAALAVRRRCHCPACRYRNNVSCYNDDIQSTAGVVLAGLINALEINGEGPGPVVGGVAGTVLH
jgi:malic enzyme